MPSPHTRSRPELSLGNSLVSAAVVLAAMLLYLSYAMATGMPLARSLLALGMIGATQVLPGAVIWRAVRPRSGWLLEDLLMGFAMGVVLAIPAQVVAGLSRQRWLAIALPLAFAGALLLVPRVRRRVLDRAWLPMPWWLMPAAVIASIAALPQLVTFCRTNRLSWPAPGAPHVDAYLHQALASQLLTRGPTSWPTVAGEDLGYHWFAHAWVAHVTATSGLGLDAVLLRLTPALMPVMVTVTVAVAMLRLTRSPRAALVAVVLTMVGGQSNPFRIPPQLWLPTSPESPTLALGVPTLLALVVILALRWRGELPRAGYLLVPLLAVVASGTKGATTPLIVAGLALAAVAMLAWNRRVVLPVLIDMVVVGLGLVFAIVVVFHGSSAGLAFGQTAAAKQTYIVEALGALPGPMYVRVVAVLVVLGGLSRAALAFVAPFSRTQRRDPLIWLLLGSAIAGACAIGIFAHPGHSQYYFLATAIPLAAMGSAIGARSLWLALGSRTTASIAVAGGILGLLLYTGPARIGGYLGRHTFDRFWLLLALGAVVLAAAAAVGWLLGRSRGGVRTALATLAMTGLFAGVAGSLDAYRPPILEASPKPVRPDAHLAVTQGELDTARFIRDHSRVDDLVMTNRHCVTPRAPYGGCDSRRWLVTAFSERQSLVEGWTATPRATRIAPHGRDSITVDYWKPDILRLNDTFIAAPTAQAQGRLWDLGVRWVYVERYRPHAASLEPYATLRYRAGDGSATAWQLNPPDPPK